jgi:glutamate dehydrogenase
MSSDFSTIGSFNDHQEIDKNKKWLHEHMPEAFNKVASSPWQTVIANQLTLLKAHEGLDHLMSKNEACIMTTRSDFDDQMVCEIFGNYFIESFHRFHSKDSFNDQGTLTIIFLKLTTTVAQKDLFEPEELMTLSSNFTAINMSFSTLCPHSTQSRLFRLIKHLKTSISHFTCHLTEYQDGYYIQLALELESGIDELMLNKTRLYLTNSYSLPSLDTIFDLEYSMVIDAIATLSHQILCQLQVDKFSLKNIEDTLLRYQDMIREVTKKFVDHHNPKLSKTDLDFSSEEQKIKSLDTGNPQEDDKRKTTLLLFVKLLKHIQKTNIYVRDKKALSFRILPTFIMKGEGFFGFHIRFKDLSRGGLRTVLSRTKEQAITDKLNVFSECYGLSFTQQKKNKDIPEGGAKGIIFSDLHNLFEIEAEKSMTKSENFFTKYRTFCQILSQKRYILSLLDLVNADEKGVLRNKDVVDFYKKPEHLFLGPDENMTDPMIEWIANTSLKKQYSTKTAFISSKPKAGINHKTYGVTSYGVNAYMDEALKFLKIDPQKQSFTVKISGGPDGDVAGNQMLNLKKYYEKTAKLVAITDVSGTIYDPEGLDLNVIEKLFHEVKPIRFYPHEKLHPGAYLLDLQTKKVVDLKEQVLLVKNEGGHIHKDYHPSTEMNLLFRQSLHQAKADIFIPAGGRPRTLNEFNVHEFLDKNNQPTSKAIVEGANLYLTPQARHFLEDKGVLIFKDSSANKGGVTCSSYEVIGGLCLNDDQFMAIKEQLVKNILQLIKDKAIKEARLMLESFSQKMGFLTDLSDEVSKKINAFKYELLNALESHHLSQDEHDPLNKIVINYVPEVIRKETSAKHILSSLSDVHKKAIIACHLASNVVYLKGLKWNPGIAELLPLLLEDKNMH